MKFSKIFYSDDKLKIVTTALFLSFFCVLLQYGSSLFGLLIAEKIDFIDDSNKWTADISGLKAGLYYVSVGRPRGLCDLRVDNNLISSTKSASGYTRESLLLGGSFEIKKDDNAGFVTIECASEGGFNVSLMRAPLIAKYRMGLTLQLWRAVTELILGPLFSLVLLLIILMMTATRGLSSELVGTKGNFSIYLLFSVTSFVYSLSLAYYTRLFLDGLSATVLHIILRTMFNITFFIVVGRYARHHWILLLILALTCLVEVVTRLMIPHYFDNVDYDFFAMLRAVTFSLLMLPIITLVYLVDFLKAKQNNKLILGIACLLLTRLFLQIVDVSITFLNTGVYLAPSAVALIAMMILMLKIAEDNMANKNSLEIKMKAERELVLFDSRLKAMTKTAQMIAHDIRRPLSALNSLVAEIKDVVLAIDRNYFSKFGVIEHMVRQALGITEDMIAVGRSAKPILNRCVCTAESLVEAAMVNMVYEKKVLFQRSGDFSVNLFVDQVKMERVLANIIENGIQAAGVSGSFWMRCVSKNNSCVIVVGNSGPKIPIDVADRLFDPFFTLGKKNGTGLGLAIAKSIVEAHGGKIWFQSSDDVGTEFFIRLPLHESNSDILDCSTNILKAKAKFRSIKEKARFSLVIVEDDPFVLERWQKLNSDWSIITFSTPHDFRLWMISATDVNRDVDVFIFDYFFSDSELTGSDLLTMIPGELRTSAIAMLCSDHELPDDEKLLYDLVISKKADSLTQIFK